MGATDLGKMPRISMMVCPSTSSATLRVLENGALKPARRRLRASSRATWSVPIQKQPMAISRSRGYSTGRHLGPRADAQEVDAAQASDQLLLGQGARKPRDVGVALGGEVGRGALVDALDQEDLQAILGERKSGQREAPSAPVFHLRQDGLRRHQVEMATARVLEQGDVVGTKPTRHSAADQVVEIPSTFSARMAPLAIGRRMPPTPSKAVSRQSTKILARRAASSSASRVSGV